MKFNSLGHRIAILRKEAHLTQLELSKMIDVSRPVIVKIENNQRVISLNEGEAISRAFGISIDTLLNYEKNETVNKTFVRAFKAKGRNNTRQEKEIRRFELLFDALCTQEIINKGE